MWTRVELKNYAKSFLKKHYLKAFIVCLIFLILSGSSDTDIEKDENRSIQIIEVKEGASSSRVFISDMGRKGLQDAVKKLGILPSFIIGSSIGTLVIIIFIINLLIGPLITIGKNRFFLDAFDDDVSIWKVFSAFNMAEFWNIFKVMFIMQIKIILWTLLFIIPGFIKGYEYSMIPYLLAENPDLTSREATEMSRELTRGNKWDIFVLDLSFLGWDILGILLFGLGYFLISPYYEATKARLYVVLSDNQLRL